MKTYNGVLTDIFDNETAQVSSLFGSHAVKPENTEEPIDNGGTRYMQWYDSKDIADVAKAVRIRNLKKIGYEVRVLS